MTGTQNWSISAKKPPLRSSASRYKRPSPASQSTILTEALQQPDQQALQKGIHNTLPLIPATTQPPTTRTATPTDDEPENDLDNEEIDKQLVMWAGRLELECIDLRDKSKGLIAELYKNSEVIQSAADDLTGTIKSLTSVSKSTDKTTPDQLKKIATKLTEMQSSMVHLYEKLDDLPRSTLQRDDKELMRKLDKISSDVSVFSGRGKYVRTALSKNAIAELSPKLLEIINIGKRSTMSQDQMMKSLESFGNDMKEISGRLNDINTLQIAFSEQLISVSKSQDCMRKEFKSLKQRINCGNYTSVPVTPDSSLISKPSVYAKRYRSQRRTRLERRLIQTSSTTTTANDSSYICLLSDDNITPDI